MKVLLLHQLPLEMYPPSLNLIRTLQERPDVQITAITSENQKGLREWEFEKCIVHRIRYGRTADSVLARLCWSLLWHVRAALICLRSRPDFVISIEPHSALAAWLWLVLLQGHSRLLIHHYEYYSPDDYLRPGNRITRFNRWFENRLLRRAVWVSQTNKDRLQFFRQDHPELTEEQCRVLPNYPPASWQADLPQSVQWPKERNVLRLVYVGAVSLHDTWIGPLVEWLNSDSNHICTLDIFSYNLDARTSDFLKQHCGENVRFHIQGVDYDKLPEMLPQFDVGLILYRCNTVNFTYNASNKLFEYLTCGLDVWYPPTMLGVKPYRRSDTAPRVFETDFSDLGRLDLGERANRNGLIGRPWTETCEDVLRPLLEVLSSEPEDSDSEWPVAEMRSHQNKSSV